MQEVKVDVHKKAASPDGRSLVSSARVRHKRIHLGSRMRAKVCTPWLIESYRQVSGLPKPIPELCSESKGRKHGRYTTGLCRQLTLIDGMYVSRVYSLTVSCDELLCGAEMPIGLSLFPHSSCLKLDAIPSIDLQRMNINVRGDSLQEVQDIELDQLRSECVDAKRYYLLNK